MFQSLTRTPLLVTLLAVTAVLCLGPALHALALRDHAVARDFLYSGLMLLVLSVLTGIATRGYAPRNVAYSQLVSLVLAYVCVPVAMTLPVIQILPDSRFANVWFEMLSSFTTTGMTVYDPARLPPSVHLWRGIAGWYGGFFVLLAGFAILAPLNLGGAEVESGRVPGRGVKGAMQVTRIADPSERVARQAFVLLPVYLGLTGVLWIGLQILGMSPLSAALYAMGTLSTSGIVGAEGLVPMSAGGVSGGGLLAEALIFLFLFLAVSRRMMPGLGPSRRDAPLRDDPELRLAVLILAAVTAVLFLRHFTAAVDMSEGSRLADALRALWGTLFTALSYLTTTGFDSAAWETARFWSGLQTPGLILMGLAILGGGVATTAGGVKLLRVYALLRHCEGELDRVIHPHVVQGGGALSRRLQREGGFLAFVFFMLFAMLIGLATAALSLTGLRFEPALVAAISALTTTGPLTGIAGSEVISPADFPVAAKAILGLCMIVGRLETLALLAVIVPQGWRR